jgi:hypothetical protein
MGAIIQGDLLNRAGSLRFRVLRDGDDFESAVRPCLPVGTGAYGADFSFSLVFWQVSGISPEQPISPTYDFFEAYLRSADRLSGTPAESCIPISLTTGGSMLSSTWQIAAELCGPIYYAGGVRGLALIRDIFRDANSGGAPLAHFSASHRSMEDDNYGLRLTIKPLARDNIGHPITRPPDSLGVAHFEVRDADGLAPLVGEQSDWTVILYFYRVK